MELLVVINLDEKTQEGPDLGLSTLAKTFPAALQGCLMRQDWVPHS